jgi:hypothetical protein
LEPQEDLGAFVSNVIDTHHESIDSRGVLCRCTRDTKLTRLACGCVIYLPPIPDIPYVSNSSSSTQFPFQKNVLTLMDMKEEKKMKNEKIVLNILSLSNLVCRDGLCLVFSPGWRDSPHTEPQRSNCALYISRLICDSNMYKGNLLLWIFISFAFASYAQSTDTARARQLERERTEY